MDLSLTIKGKKLPPAISKPREVKSMREDKDTRGKISTSILQKSSRKREKNVKEESKPRRNT